MKILVIFTGGTIGCVEENGWRDISDSARYTLLNKYKEQYGDTETEFDVLAPYSILSEQLSHNELNLLLNTVKSALNKDYDGIIVTHGTDTLQYTAAALAFSFHNCHLPIMLVSSDNPLDDENANGIYNFGGAVAFIKHAFNGVYVSYKNTSDNKIHIHSAPRLASHGECSSDVCSIDGQPYAFCDKNSLQIKLNENFVHGDVGVPCDDILYSTHPRVLMIICHPSDSYDYCISRYKAIILIPYHSGTLNTSSDAFIKFCSDAQAMDIPVFVTRIYSNEGYASTKAFSSLGIIPLPYCAAPAAFMKCWAAVSLNEDIKKFVLSPLAGEFVPLDTL